MKYLFGTKKERFELKDRSKEWDKVKHLVQQEHTQEEIYADALYYRYILNMLYHFVWDDEIDWGIIWDDPDSASKVMELLPVLPVTEEYYNYIVPEDVTNVIATDTEDVILFLLKCNPEQIEQEIKYYQNQIEEIEHEKQVLSQKLPTQTKESATVKVEYDSMFGMPVLFYNEPDVFIDLIEQKNDVKESIERQMHTLIYLSKFIPEAQRCLERIKEEVELYKERNKTVEANGNGDEKRRDVVHEIVMDMAFMGSVYEWSEEGSEEEKDEEVFKDKNKELDSSLFVEKALEQLLLGNIKEFDRLHSLIEAEYLRDDIELSELTIKYIERVVVAANQIGRNDIISKYTKIQEVLDITYDQSQKNLDEKLYQAVKDLDHHKVQLYLALGANPNKQFEGGKTVLHILAEEQSFPGLQKDIKSNDKVYCRVMLDELQRYYQNTKSIKDMFPDNKEILTEEQKAVFNNNIGLLEQELFKSKEYYREGDLSNKAYKFVSNDIKNKLKIFILQTPHQRLETILHYVDINKNFSDEEYAAECAKLNAYSDLEYNRTKVMQSILQEKRCGTVDVTVRDKNNNTPLELVLKDAYVQRAGGQWHITKARDIIKMLLNNGADPMVGKSSWGMRGRYVIALKISMLLTWMKSNTVIVTLLNKISRGVLWHATYQNVSATTSTFINNSFGREYILVNMTGVNMIGSYVYSLWRGYLYGDSLRKYLGNSSIGYYDSDKSLYYIDERDNNLDLGIDYRVLMNELVNKYIALEQKKQNRGWHVLSVVLEDIKHNAENVVRVAQQVHNGGPLQSDEHKYCTYLGVSIKDVNNEINEAILKCFVEQSNEKLLEIAAAIKSDKALQAQFDKLSDGVNKGILLVGFDVRVALAKVQFMLCQDVLNAKNINGEFAELVKVLGENDFEVLYNEAFAQYSESVLKQHAAILFNKEEKSKVGYIGRAFEYVADTLGMDVGTMKTNVSSAVGMVAGVAAACIQEGYLCYIENNNVIQNVAMKILSGGGWRQP